ncbi:Metallo-dependent phosphatase-like protein [Delphinella strobiligena]|nr:Metallo-dependent phosphatase-like protein [Delphinella strobiligena]
MSMKYRASPPVDDDDDDDDRGDDRPLSAYVGRDRSHESRPLIDQVTNSWRYEKTTGLSYEEEEITDLCDLDSENSFVLAIVRNRRIRRTMLFVAAVLISVYCGYRWFLKPGWDQETVLMQSFNQPVGAFGLQDAQKFSDIIQIQELAREYKPGGKHDSEGKRRLIFVGDIHGCHEELMHLLKKVRFNKETDHLICTGDIIAKGPDSLGVIDTLISMNASSVRGNHEDKVLLPPDRSSENAHLDAERRKAKAAGLKGEALSRYLLPHHRAWLRALPLIIHITALRPISAEVPPLPHSQMEDADFSDESQKGERLKHVKTLLDDINVVHGGLVPGLPLRRQDPYSVMNMRSMSEKSHVPSSERDSGVPWEGIWGWYNDRLAKHLGAKSWSWFEEDYDRADTSGEDADAVSRARGWRSWLDRFFGRRSSLVKLKLDPPSVVIYGHDSPRGLNLHRWSKGLDSGCVKGGQLTALVLDAWGQAHLVQVGCKNHL